MNPSASKQGPESLHRKGLPLVRNQPLSVLLLSLLCYIVIRVRRTWAFCFQIPEEAVKLSQEAGKVAGVTPVSQGLTGRCLLLLVFPLQLTLDLAQPLPAPR